MKSPSGKVLRPRGRPRSFDREAALERAMELFWRQGYETTSISDLTAAMGITPPSLYAAFGDKERLFLEAVERYRCRRGGAGVFDDEATARGAVARLLEAVATEATSPDTPPGCMLITAAVNCSAESAHLQGALAEHRAATLTKLRERIGRGVEEGELPADTDADALARFYATVIQGMTIQARDGVSREDLLAVGAAAMAAWPAARRAPRKRR
jgi:TetR/AcrR family transcriptional regulator, copper-responsive repressor